MLSVVNKTEGHPEENVGGLDQPGLNGSVQFASTVLSSIAASFFPYIQYMYIYCGRRRTDYLRLAEMGRCQSSSACIIRPISINRSAT